MDITDPKNDINKMRQKMGMVFQQFNLFPHMTVKENIKLALIKPRPDESGRGGKEGAGVA